MAQINQPGPQMAQSNQTQGRRRRRAIKPGPQMAQINQPGPQMAQSNQTQGRRRRRAIKPGPQMAQKAQMKNYYSAMRAIAVALGGLTLALLFVGVVSGTVLRHVVQVLPIVAALLVTIRRPAHGASAAIPIFFFWILIVSLIWMFLLGISTFARGTYTVAEIAATVVMAACSVVGLVRSVSTSRGIRITARIGLIALFTFLQVATMVVSMMRAIANR